MTSYNLTPKEIEISLQTDLNLGLTQKAAEERIKEYGENKITFTKKITLLKLFIEQISNPLVLMLIGTSIVAIFTGEVIESILIISIVMFMSIIGVLLENTANKALDKLKNLSSTYTSVIREGKIKKVKSSEIIPGDILYLQEGEKVPADARLFEINDLQTDESILTGESIPASKNLEIIKQQNVVLGDQHNMIFSGTFIIQGNCKAIVVSTGPNAELGKIAEELSNLEEKKTPLQKQLEKLSKLILILTLAICLAILILGIYRGQSIIDSLLQSLSLAISFIPEGLSAVMTVTLAIGVREMVKKNVIIKRLIAAEGLGSISILATDKTGTITTGKMSVEKLWGFGKDIDTKILKPKTRSELNIIDIIRYCNNSKGATEDALINFIEEKGFEYEIGDRLHEHRFSSDLKRMTVIHKKGDSILAYSKGAPDYLIPLCTEYLEIETGKNLPLTLEKQLIILRKFEELASMGYRVLSLANKEYPKNHKPGDRLKDESNLVFVGLIGLIDPVRSEVKETVEKLIISGIKPIMITGDHKEIARTIALESGIMKKDNQNVITGSELEEFFAGKGNLTEEEIVKTAAFARVTPEHKNKLLDIFKSKNKNIAMAGDGINDAVAVSKADVGIAVANATDIVREAADVVITGDYSSLGNAVEVGRIIMFRTRLYLHFLLSGNVCQVAVFLIAFILNLPVPLTPISLLLINLLTDAAPAMSMSVEKGNDDLMKDRPRDTKEGIINRMMWRSILIQGVASSIYLFLIFYLTLPYGINFAQTATFTSYIFHDLLRAVSARSFKRSLLEYGIFSNKFNIISILIGAIALYLIVYVFNTAFEMEPLPLNMIIILFISALIFPALEEFIKYRNKIDF